jgi:peroxiredoxin
MKKIAAVVCALLLLPAAAGAAIQAPDFSGTDIQGAPQSLAQYHGKPLVLYFWATWCPACRRDVQAIHQVYLDFKDKGIGFVTVSLDEDLEALKKYVAQENLQFPVLFDGKGWKNEMAGLYGIKATPGYVLISPQGSRLGSGGWSKDLRPALEGLAGKRAEEITVPPFKGTDLHGVEHDLSKYAGKPLVLYFWATWCPACRQDIKEVVKLYKKYQSKGVEFLSISLDTELDKLRDYTEKNKISFPVLFEGRAWDNENARRYGVNSTPSFFLISADQGGMASGSWHNELEAELKALLS